MVLPIAAPPSNFSLAMPHREQTRLGLSHAGMSLVEETVPRRSHLEHAHHTWKLFPGYRHVFPAWNSLSTQINV